MMILTLEMGSFRHIVAFCSGFPEDFRGGEIVGVLVIVYLFSDNIVQVIKCERNKSKPLY